MLNHKQNRILVTGGAGFLGSHLCESLIREGSHVICVDNFFTGHKSNIGHLIDNKNYDYLPSEEFLFDKIKPVYKKVAGWEKSTAGINKFNDLPENAKKYIQILEDLMETNISIVSTGPDRKETIDINGTLSNI